MADKEFSFWGQNPANPAEAPVEEVRSLQEWAGWPRKKLPKSQPIVETTLEQAMVDKHVGGDDAPKAPAQDAAPAPADDTSTEDPASSPAL